MKSLKTYGGVMVRLVAKWLAWLTLWRYRPGIVGVTGSVGKTSTKHAIAAVLGSDRSVRFAKGNFNNEFGLPLTILGEWDEIRGFFFWPKVFLVAITNLIFRVRYPDILVLEYGADKPGDLSYLLSIARPNVGVITAIGDIPVHVEHYSGPEEVVREKAKLIERLPAAGFAILNGDDESVRRMEDWTRAHVIRYGFSRDAEMRITRLALRSDNGVPRGITFHLEHGGTRAAITLSGAFGKAQAYAAAAGAAVGILFGQSFPRVVEALASYRPPPHRMEMLPGIKYTTILDDAYNSSPLSTQEALETVAAFPAKRVVAILGDMLELGKYSLEAHEHLGRLAARHVNVLVAVGPRAKFIAEAARGARMQKRDIYQFETAEEARRPVQDLLRKGDVVLVKGSRAMRLEVVVDEIKEVQRMTG